MSTSGELCFCSWSGGKDSCLALHRALASGMQPAALLTMLAETGNRSRSHGLSTELLRRQASSLGIRLITRNASWDDYEAEFLDAARQFHGEGVSAGVFGDIDLELHREWVDRICSSIGVRMVMPLWKSEREDLLEEFLSKGFRAIIVSVKSGVLDENLFLGRYLDSSAIEEMNSAGIDAGGEGGEYHTFVVDGPIFSSPVDLEARDIHFRDGYWFLDLI
ncbi:MAG: diphthine--ammonia ligase [Methanobacteriota archaeon]|nr:MAG: diphthine--ammonia ligase [Euryarchaeota archaeon]